MSKEAEDFIRAQTALGTAAIVPEIQLQLATEVTPLWQLTEDRLKQSGLPPPYWAFAWPGGQGIARYILDHPDKVRGKRVMDFAGGCGIAAIAAMKAGAKSAVMVDIDSMAQIATYINAAHNDVAVEVAEEVDFTKPAKNIDVIVAGDVCYQQAMAAQLTRWLWLCVANGVHVLLADPGRAYVPKEGLKERAHYVVPTSRDLEDRERRNVTVWEMVEVPKED